MATLSTQAPKNFSSSITLSHLHILGISPFDSAVQGGDATWEGLRVYRGKVLLLERHLQRLIHSTKALGFQNVHSRDEIKEAIFQVLAANGMRDGAHMRLTLTR